MILAKDVSGLAYRSSFQEFVGGGRVKIFAGLSFYNCKQIEVISEYYLLWLWRLKL